MEPVKGSWEEMIAQGEKGPGSTNKKAEAAIQGARAKEDPAKVPYHPGIKSMSIHDGKLNLEQFNKAEAATMPQVGDGSLLLDINPAAADFYKSAMATEKEEIVESGKKKEEQTATSSEPKEEIPVRKMTYEQRLKYYGIEEEKARKILDSLFSDDGYYEESFKCGKVNYTLRTCRGEPLSYIFSKLTKYNKMTPDGTAITDEYMYHKNKYLLAVNMVSCDGHYLVDNGKKTPKAIDATLQLLDKIPDFIIQKMTDSMIDFEAIIKIVTGDGCENFF